MAKKMAVEGIYVDKPILRGQFHKFGAIFYPPLLGLPLYLMGLKKDNESINTTTSQEGGGAGSAALMFNFAVELIMTISATLHTYRWKSQTWYLRTRKLDFMGIFFGIALFYSSMGRLLMGHHPWWISYIEPLVWTCACVGSALKWLWPDAPQFVNAAIFLLQGWATAPCIPCLIESATLPESVGLVMGGIFATLGALSYALQWPYNKKNKKQTDIVIGPHEVFHIGTILMFLSFWYTMWSKLSSL